MEPLPPKMKELVEKYESDIKDEFGEAFFERLVAGRYNQPDFWKVRRFLATLIQ